MTWHQDVMGFCPHGQPARPYCGVCASEDVAAEREARRPRDDGVDVGSLEQTVKRQSAALRRAYSHIEVLERRRRG